MVTDHIPEDLLVKYALKKEDFEPDALLSVERHLRECLLCSEKFETVREFWKSVEQHLAEGPSDRDTAFAETLVDGGMRALPQRGLERKSPEEKVIEAYAEVMGPDKRSLPSRMVRYVRNKPIQTMGMAIIFGVLAIYSISEFSSSKDMNPAFAEIKNYVLTTYNKEADVLWKKGVPGIPDWNSRTPANQDGTNPRRFLSVRDIDDDLKNEVLLVGNTQEGEYASDTIYCFGESGAVRWKTGVGPMVTFGPPEVTHQKRPVINDFVSVKRRPSDRTRLFVLAGELTFSPTKLFEIDPRSGAILHSFFNRGGLGVLISWQIKNTGEEDLVVGGVNDGFNRACIVVLDPGRIEGYSPLLEKEELYQGHLASMMYYLLFPRSGLARATHGALYGSVRDIASEPDGTFSVKVAEMLVDPSNGQSDVCSLYYKLGQNMRALSVMADDNYVRIAQNSFKAGVLKSSFAPSDVYALKDSVLYWDGAQFVHGPMKNKTYTLSESASNSPNLP